jgi:hypothetical protein
MGLGELLTTEEKIASLQKMKKSLSMAIYPLCIELGIDPESFDCLTYVSPVGNSTTGFTNPKFAELEKHSSKLVILMAKLKELQSA